MMSSCEDEPGTGVLIPSSSTNPDKEQHTERVFTNKGVREFLVIEHTANLRNNIRTSAIQYYRDKRRRLNDKSIEKYWRYAYYIGKATVVKIDGENREQTSYILAHLKNKHKIDYALDNTAILSSITALGVTASAGA